MDLFDRVHPGASAALSGQLKHRHQIFSREGRMRQRIIDLRNDETTAGYIADALQLQVQYGFDHATHYLHAHGVNAQLAQRLLAIRYDRRARLAPASACEHGHAEAHAPA
jgi:tryptophan synthase beta subunit